jgi:carboxypeptidase PM20D1
VINEGGIGIQDLLFEGQTAYAISVGEKGVLWLRMTATGEPGHGSTPKPGEAPDILLDALEKLRAYEAVPRVHPALWEFLGNASVAASGLTRFVFGHPALARRLVTPRLMADPLTRAVVTDTVHITGFAGAKQPNVVPSQVSALLDCRLLPGTTAQAHLALIESIVDDDRVRFEVLSAHEATVSEWQGDPVYEALARRVVLGVPGAIAGPVISPGYTDSIAVRPLGTRAYGLAPFSITLAEAATMHGDGEYLSTENLTHGLQVLLGVVADVALVR